MSWHYSQAQAVASSEDCCTGGELLPPLKSKITHAEFYCNGKLMASYLDSLSGTMYAPLTEPSGEEWSMSSAEASRAKISVAQGKVLALLELEAVYGVRWRESFAKLDRDTCSWKTRQCLLLGGLESFSETWPKWGMMRDGECSERVMPAHPTSGTGSGYWRSPSAQEPGITNERLITKDGEAAKPGQRAYDKDTGRLCQVGLTQQVKMWPTPTANEDAAGTPDGKMQWMLTQSAKSGCTTRKEYKDGGTKTRQTWPTPGAMDGMRQGKANAPNQDGRLECQIAYRESATTNKGQLNPSWVEWLMGWPIGFTDSKPLAMDKFRRWLHSHGKSWEGR